MGWGGKEGFSEEALVNPEKGSQWRKTSPGKGPERVSRLVPS